MLLRNVHAPTEARGSIGTSSIPESRRETWRRRAATRPPDGPGIFSRRWRRLGVLWVALTVPIATLAGAFVHDESAYLVGWVLVSGLYTAPAVVVTWVIGKRVRADGRRFWRLWGIGLAFCYGFGISILLMASTGHEWLEVPADVSVALATLAFTIALVMLMRERSGSRQVWVDFCQSAMLVLGISALAIPSLAGPLFSSSATWYVLPAILTAISLLAAFSWSLRLFGRLGGGPRTMEALGVTVALTGSLSAAAQVAQGLSGFTLPGAPIYGLQALCMGLLLLTPLHAPKRNAAGLDRLPPQDQVRRGGIDAIIAIALLGVLFVECSRLVETVPWAYQVFGVVAMTQLFLATVEYLLANEETKRLYRQVEVAAAERRELLEEMVRGIDRDRHRVAAQLHEQAIAAYVSFSEFARSSDAERAPTETPGPRASGGMRTTADAMGHQAEALRELMLAVTPIEVGTSGPNRLATPAAAYLHSLYGDVPVPALIVQADDDLELDWTTETIVFRILQEAFRNVWAHSGAKTVRVELRLSGDLTPELRIEDDGSGFDPSTAMYESGIAVMRTFASLTDGEVEIVSAPGHGTSIVARLGGTRPSTIPAVSSSPAGDAPRPAPSSMAPGPDRDRPRLRVIDGGARDVEQRTPAPG